MEGFPWAVSVSPASVVLEQPAEMFESPGLAPTSAVGISGAFCR